MRFCAARAREGRAGLFAYAHSGSMKRMLRANRGLYGNRMIQFGNKKSFAENKTRRTWLPNVQKISFFSEALQRKVQFRITCHALRTVNKLGGIDEYLVHTRDSEIKYPYAIQLKQQIKVLRAATLLPKDTAAPLMAADEDAPGLKHRTPIARIGSRNAKRVGLQQLV